MAPMPTLFIRIRERVRRISTRASTRRVRQLHKAVMAAYQDYVGAWRRAAQPATRLKDLTAGESRWPSAARRLSIDSLPAGDGPGWTYCVDVCAVAPNLTSAPLAAACWLRAEEDSGDQDLSFCHAGRRPGGARQPVLAMRLSRAGAKRPELGLRIALPGWVEMLNSIVLVDRQQSALALSPDR